MNVLTTGHGRRRLIGLGVLFFLICVSCGLPAPAQPGQLPSITADSAQLLAGDTPFEIRGVNYIRPTGADPARCPELQFGADANCPWEIGPIAADMDRLRVLGVNTVRVFLNYYVFGGARAADPNYRVDQPLAHLDALLAEANRRGIYVLPVLLAKYPQDRFSPDAYPTALDLHVRPVVRHLAGRPGLLAWDLFNEPDLGGPVDQRCWDWDNADFPPCFPLANERLHFVKMLNDEVKRLDPARLTTVSLGFAKNYFEPHNAELRLADVVDVYSFHYYDDDPYDSGRYAAHWYYGEGFPQDLRRAVGELHALTPARPVVITELGFPAGPGATRTPDDLRRDLAQALLTARDERTSGMILWSFQERMEDLVGDLFTK
jgi:hypothetical protein